MHYYVMKTGMEMFDACRAYGLGLAVERLTGESTFVSDRGMYYLVKVDVAEIGELSKEEIKKKLLPLFAGRDLSWGRTFLTIQRKQTGELKRSTRRLIEKAKKIILEGAGDIIEKFKSPSPVKIPDPTGETLYLSMELAATKGYRVPIRTKSPYTEGTPLKVPAVDWALAALGETYFATWKNTIDALIFVVPKPTEVGMGHARDIQSILNKTRVCRTSTLTALAHMAVIIARDMQERKKSRDPFLPKFCSLIYGACVMTGAQLKPKSGGVFSLELLLNLMERDLETSEEIFELWDYLFKIGAVKGREELSLSLSKFIAYPTISNLEEHLRAYLRHAVKGDVKLKNYPKHSITEVLGCVRS